MARKKRGAPSGKRKHQILKGDRVRVIRGNFRDAEGTVLRVLPREDRVVVEGVRAGLGVRGVGGCGRLRGRGMVGHSS